MGLIFLQEKPEMLLLSEPGNEEIRHSGIIAEGKWLFKRAGPNYY